MALGTHDEPLRTVTAGDLVIAKRVADYYAAMKAKAVHEPALSSCTVAFQQALTRTQGDPVQLVVGKEEAA